MVTIGQAGAALAVAGVGILTALPPAGARGQEAAGTTLCRMIWDGETTGRGDTESSHAEFQVTRAFSTGDGGYMAFASGEATVTYRTSARGCTILSGSPYTAKFEATLSSDDGRSAKVDISAAEEQSHSLTLSCQQQGLGRLRNVETGGGKQSVSEVEPAEPPAITVPLKDGSTPYAESHGPRGRKGTLTLQYCKSDKNE